MGSSDRETARLARGINDVAMKSPPSLMEDEQEICSSLEISSSKHLSYIRYYEITGRVSAHWEATVASLRDVARWSLLAPPNDEKKSNLLAGWVADKLKRVLDELARFEVPPGKDSDNDDSSQ
jgi:hypothetical protein